MNANGESVGSVTLSATPQGTLLHAKLENLPAGAHAFHVHAVGVCEAPFKSAGGHFNPAGREARDREPRGDARRRHAQYPRAGLGGAGDRGAEHAAASWDASLFDEDGASIVIHDGPDDYTSDPAGAAGPRIACGVITQ